MFRLNPSALIPCILILAVLAGPAALPAQSYGYDGPESIEEARPNPAPSMRMRSFDLAEDAAQKFVFDEGPVSEDGLPKYGNAFVTGGYIYPAGTLDATNGVNPDGSPEFPAMVMGTWYCKGYFIADFTPESQGPLVLTTQVFDFGDEPGRMTMTTEGLESATVGEEIKRAITGGTGRYRNVRGQIVQELLGANVTEGVNLRIRVQASYPNRR